MPKISLLDPAAALGTSDFFALVQGGATFRATIAQVAAAVLASPVITQSLQLSGAITPAAFAATQNDYAPVGLSAAAVARLTATGAQSITGIAGGAAGRVLILQNVGAAAISLLNANTGSTAANRFAFSYDRTIEPGRVLILIYDVTQSRWIDAEPLTKALAATMWAGVNDERFITAKGLFDASAPVSVAYAASIALDFATGINFDLGALTGALTLENPTNAKIGQSGRIRIPQDAAGSRLITYGAWFKAPGGPQALSTAPAAVDALYYFVRDATTVEYTLARAFS